MANSVEEKYIIGALAPAGKHMANSTINIASLFNQLFKHVPEREAKVLKMRFGLENFEKHTLEAIGQVFGITRERVRQIENTAIKKLSAVHRSAEFTQILDMAFNTLTLHGGVLIKNALLINLWRRINSNSKADMNYLELAITMSDRITTVNNTVKFHPYYFVNTLGETTVRDAADAVISKLNKKKNVISITETHELISSSLGLKMGVTTISNICKTSKALKLTDSGDVGLFKWAHINPRNIHDKIIFVMKKYGKPIHFAELTAQIKKYEFDEKLINVQAVHNELIRNDAFVLIGRGIYALAEWGYKPGTVGDVIIDILKKHGPLDRDTIIEKVLEVRQVKKITIQLNLKNRKLFERVGRNTYGLKK